jgi:hypothetical protein
MQRDEKRLTDAERVAFLADRMAILLVVCKSRYGDDWNPWFREGLWVDEGALGEEVRAWPEYQTALEIVRNMLRKQDDNHRRKREKD